MYEFRLPDVGEGLHEAELLEWDVNIGDSVAEGDAVAQVSTDKVNVELPAPCGGVVAELPWSPGDVIQVGEILMCIDDGKGEQSATVDEKAAAAKMQAAPALVQAQRKKVKAGPTVRRYAAQKKVDLTLVEPGGAGGQIVQQDIDNYLAQSTVSAPVPQATDDSEGVTRIKLSGPRLVAARKLEESSRTLATTTLSFDVVADALMEEYLKFRNKAEQKSVKLTPLAVIAKCVCYALQKHPNFNATVVEKERALDVHEAIHLGAAVDTSDGLVVPVIRDAGSKSVIQIGKDIATLAERARSGSLKVADFRGSTFTVSSTGGLERTAMTGTTPVINLPNVATLWVSRIMDRPRVVEGTLSAGPMMACSLSLDHRFLHGADGTAFINTLDEAFRDPAQGL